MFRPRRLLPSQVRSNCIASPAFSSFNFELSTFHFPVPSPFSAALTGNRQLTEDTITLSPAFATPTRRVKRNLCVCHSCKKHRGWVPTNPRRSILPMHFPLFPQRVNIQRIATPATPIGSCAYFTLSCIPWEYLSPPTLPPSRAPIPVPPLSRSRQMAQNVRR